ncbi:transporter substrate-binding domain-containing protein (plasmid) [Mesorhizobium sp. AR07]|uniref:transporter substrate-binding domain-containing protein n=1 Tax=Mesorhizobium sp. AR07 TaxID=2865838 RepID=UPI00215E9452|nr:transporter substrate-binding domain-containing protein [Mesorhizobium sp. AR07]UVK48043.1 transporter substrate-binding domain-containing protein [Mesorhizobium sp. AR07]
MRVKLTVGYFCTALALAFAATPSAHASVLDDVKQRGILNCAIDNTIPGFSYLNPKTAKLEGLDIDLCRATAAAVLGSPDKVSFIIVTAKSRFNAVTTGQADVAYLPTTVYPVRESAISIDFLPIYFYDGGGFMVKASSGVKTLEDLSGGTICTTQGSGTEVTLANLFKAKNVANINVLTFDADDKIFAALGNGRCNAMATDRTALAGWRASSPNPADYNILKESTGKSPFAGFVVANDSKWRNLLRWTIFALFQAEEWGITTANLGEMQKSPDPVIQKFLGVNGGFGTDFHVSDSFVADMIKAVGNYGEMYDRNLGPDTPYSLDRTGTPNASWVNGGLLFSAPWE